MSFLKSTFSLLILTVLILTSACGGEAKPVASRWKTWELNGKDTINHTDTTGLKQGEWLFFLDKGKKAKKDEVPVLLVKGTYVDDKREGTWYYFSVDGNPSDTVRYQNDFPVD